MSATAAPARPRVVVLDVNETLSDMSPLAERFAELGVPRELAAVWFAGLLRDGFALTLTGVRPDFAAVGRELLAGMLGPLPIDRALDEAVDHVMGAFTSLSLHPDVAPGLQRLHDLGLELVTLSNGSSSVAEGLFERAGLRGLLTHVLSVDDADGWKPAASAYAYAGEVCGVQPHEMVLVAVHPWDVHGASRAGLRTAFVARSGQRYPAHFDAPDLVVDGLEDLAARLVATG